MSDRLSRQLSHRIGRVKSQRRTDALTRIRTHIKKVSENRYMDAQVIEQILSSQEFVKAIFCLFSSNKKDNEIMPISQFLQMLQINIEGKAGSARQVFYSLVEAFLSLETSKAEDGESNIDLTLLSKLFTSRGFSGRLYDVLIEDAVSEAGWEAAKKARFHMDIFMRFIQNLTIPLSRRPINEIQMKDILKTFRSFADENEEIDINTFRKMVTVKNQFFVDRAFMILDRTNNGKVSVDEYSDTLHQLMGGKDDDIVKFLFRVYDINGDGYLSEEELTEALRASLVENGMDIDEEQLKNLCEAFWSDTIDEKSSNNMIKYSDLKRQLDRHDGLIAGLGISLQNWLLPNVKIGVMNTKAFRYRERMEAKMNYVKNNLAFVIFMVSYYLMNIGLFIWRAVVYSKYRNYDGSDPNIGLMLARANGIVLHLNSMLVLILVLRHTLTIMRRMGLAAILPIDNNISIHKIVGIVIFFQSWFHSISHFVNFGINVQPHPIEFVVANIDLVDLSVGYKPPEGCTVDLVNSKQICTGNGRPYSYVEWMFTLKPGLFGLIPGIANLSGVILLFSITVIWAGSFMRRRGYFEVFYFSHLLYIVYFLMWIIHAPSSWKWIVAPGILFILEIFYRFLFANVGELGNTLIQTAHIHPSKVIQLDILRPKQFNYSPGDWVFIKIPQIAHFEWHPFTISSAPQNQDVFTLHVRAVGGWTNQLYDYFKTEPDKKKGVIKAIKRSVTQFRSTVLRRNFDPNTKSSARLNELPQVPQESVKTTNQFRKPGLTRKITFRLDQRIEETPAVEDPIEDVESPKLIQPSNSILRDRLKVYINGPYGAPASNIFRAEHAVLIATGIGVTPFASILQSIMNIYFESQRSCHNCGEKLSDLRGMQSLRKVDFMWLNRDQRSFEWFVDILSKLEIEQRMKGGAELNRFLDMHLYITSALDKCDMRALGLQLAMDLLHQKDKRDLLTGLTSRTKAGRPDWDKVFTDLKSENKGQITVFFCGNPSVAAILREKCIEYDFNFRKEVF